MKHDGEDGEQSTDHLYYLALEQLKKGALPSEVEAMLAEFKDQPLPPEKETILRKMQKRQRLLSTNIEAIAKRLESPDGQQLCCPIQ